MVLLNLSATVKVILKIVPVNVVVFLLGMNVENVMDQVSSGIKMNVTAIIKNSIVKKFVVVLTVLMSVAVVTVLVLLNHTVIVKVTSRVVTVSVDLI